MPRFRGRRDSALRRGAAGSADELLNVSVVTQFQTESLPTSPFVQAFAGVEASNNPRYFSAVKYSSKTFSGEQGEQPRRTQSSPLMRMPSAYLAAPIWVQLNVSTSSRNHLG